jgi:hypothetical protein
MTSEVVIIRIDCLVLSVSRMPSGSFLVVVFVAGHLQFLKESREKEGQPGRQIVRREGIEEKRRKRKMDKPAAATEVQRSDVRPAGAAFPFDNGEAAVVLFWAPEPEPTKGQCCGRQVRFCRETR